MERHANVHLSGVGRLSDGPAHEPLRPTAGHSGGEGPPRAPLRLCTPWHLVMGALALPLQTGLLATSGGGGAKLELRRRPKGGLRAQGMRSSQRQHEFVTQFGF